MSKHVEDFHKKGSEVFDNVKKQVEINIRELPTNIGIKNAAWELFPLEKEHQNRNICLFKIEGLMVTPFVVVENETWPFKYTVHELKTIFLSNSSVADRDYALVDAFIALHKSKDAVWCEKHSKKTLTDDFKRTMAILEVVELDVTDYGIPYNGGMWAKLNITFKDLIETTPDVV